MTDDNFVHISGNQRVLTPVECVMEDIITLEEQIRMLTMRVEVLEKEIGRAKE